MKRIESNKLTMLEKIADIQNTANDMLLDFKEITFIEHEYISELLYNLRNKINEID